MASHSACLFLYSIYICKRGFIIYISAFRLLVEKQPYKIKLLQKTSAYICKRRCYAISKEIESLKPRSKFLNKKKIENASMSAISAFATFWYQSIIPIYFSTDLVVAFVENRKAVQCLSQMSVDFRLGFEYHMQVSVFSHAEIYMDMS